MGFWEILAAAGGALVLLGGVAGALTDLFRIPGRVLRWLRRAVQAVDVITSIPDRLATVETLTTDLVQVTRAHLEVADGKTALLDSIASDLGVLIPQVADVHHEVKHNGGSSIKDAVARLEEGVQGLYTPTLTTGPVTVITAAPVKRRTRTSKESS